MDYTLLFIFIFLVLGFFLAFSFTYLQKSTTDTSITKFLSQLEHEKENQKDITTVLLVFAHPDDEAMFFTPLLNAFNEFNLNISEFNKQKREYENKQIQFHFLCITRGNYDGLGDTREAEMQRSALFYGATSCTVVSDDRCLDGPKSEWDMEFVAYEIIQRKIYEIGADAVFTFDEGGVSGHKNHIDVFGAVRLCQARMRRVNSSSSTLTTNEQEQQEQQQQEQTGETMKKVPLVYKLVSLSLFQKYSSVLGVLLRNLDFDLEKEIANKNKRLKTMEKQQLRFLISCRSIMLAMRGLWTHRSQFVWFRFFYVLFASYTYECDFVSI